jgi:uncharacterized membrane protein YeaQ/YmgE (transglycosylase-associated protein family)
LLIFAIVGIGFLSGWVAQIILGRGGRPNGESLIAGIAGSFVGGLLISLIAGDGFDIRPSGMIGSIIGAVIVLAIWYAVRREPAAPPPQTTSRSGGGSPTKKATNQPHSKKRRR